MFLEIYKGSYIDDEGKRKHIREYEYLKKYLYEEPQNAKERKENREALEFAQNDIVVIYYLAQNKSTLASKRKSSRRSFVKFFELRSNI